MIIKLKELTNTLSMVADIVGNNKNQLYVMFDLRTDEVRVNFTDGNSSLTKKVEAIIEETDVRERVAFDLKRLTNLIEACKPTGIIITEDVKFTFGENSMCNVKAEKYLPTGDGDERKIASVVDQKIRWEKIEGSPSMRLALLSRSDYDALLHIDDDLITEDCTSMPNSEWMDICDKWDTLELKGTLSRLSDESGKIAYIAPKTKCGFVVNTSMTIQIPLENEIRNKAVLSTTLSKAAASLLSKIEDDNIFTHPLDEHTVVYSTEDSRIAFSIKNGKIDTAHKSTLNNCISKKYDTHLINFHRDVLYSCIHGAKVASESDKIEIQFKNVDEDGIPVFKMIMVAKNTNKSIDNNYDIDAEYVLNREESDGLKLNVTIGVLDQALSNIGTEYVAFDVDVAPNGEKMIRLSEIDLNKRVKVNRENEKEDNSSWDTEFTINHRKEMLGYTTFFRVSAD